MISIDVLDILLKYLDTNSIYRKIILSDAEHTDPRSRLKVISVLVLN